MSVDLKIDKALIITNLDADTSEEVLGKLADNLYNNGYVDKNYKEAVLDREKIYPTGLPSPAPSVAIPHADYNLVKRTTISVATLAHPVSFHDMGDVKNTVDVSIVIMMAISEPHGQVEMLQKIVEVIQDDSLRNNLMNAKNSDELYELLNKIF